MKTSKDLSQLLDSVHRKSYPAYKSLKGEYNFTDYILSIDHVQGDPFASPSKIRLIIDNSRAGFPANLYDCRHKKIALEDHLIRLFYEKISRLSFKAGGSGKSGLISISRCGQEVLERTACHMDGKRLEVRFEIGFPANGRTINAIELKKILFEFIPPSAEESFYYKNLKQENLKRAVMLAEDQEYIRQELKKRNLAAFVSNGAILPRESGISSRPLKAAVPFQSPKSLEVVMELPNKGALKGMGVPKGITLIVGGGYHGKSTLLKALECGVYNHIHGDGRQYVIADDTSVKLRAEDGRNIQKVDISAFINHLPNAKDTVNFSTMDASGSTSQAANVIEALEAGTKLFLIDEDTTAANFMVRDALMQKVISREKEPITPFSEVVRALYEEWQVSTVLVAGSSGAYFYKADTILQMDAYNAIDITKNVKELLEIEPEYRADTLEFQPNLPKVFSRVIGRKKADGRDERQKIKVHGMDEILLGKETIDLRYVEQLVDIEQTAALGYILNYMLLNLADGRKTMQTVVDQMEQLLTAKSMAVLAQGSYLPSNLAMPRVQEIYACLNRYRKLTIL